MIIRILHNVTEDEGQLQYERPTEPWARPGDLFMEVYRLRYDESEDPVYAAWYAFTIASCDVPGSFAEPAATHCRGYLDRQVRSATACDVFDCDATRDGGTRQLLALDPWNGFELIQFEPQLVGVLTGP